MVSPSPSPATAASASVSWRSNASTTAARIRRGTARIGSSSARGSAISTPLGVVHAGDGPQLGGLLLRRRIVEEVAAADLRPGEVLLQPGLPERRMDLDVEVERGVGLPAF